jgi:hypothetical protein
MDAAVTSPVFWGRVPYRRFSDHGGPRAPFPSCCVSPALIGYVRPVRASSRRGPWVSWCRADTPLRVVIAVLCVMLATLFTGILVTVMLE